MSLRSNFTKVYLVFILLFITVNGYSQQKIPRACVGKSITYGATIENREANSYPAQLASMLGEGYQVENIGKNGATLLRKGDNPYWETGQYQEALLFNPICLAGKIADAGFSVLHEVGDADDVVPVSDNTAVYEKSVIDAGGAIGVIHKPGIGHHPHSLSNPQPIVDFVLQSQNRQGQKYRPKPNKGLITKIKKTNGFVALWAFQEPPGKSRKAIGKGTFPLQENNGEIERINEGPVSGYSIRLDGTKYLNLPNPKTKALNIFGENREVTVMAWVKWSGEQIGFVGGMWNEYQEGGKRQYGLFVSLPYYNGANQVCGHISRMGGPTEPFPFSIDYSASKQIVPKNQWCCIAFTYNGKYIKSYLNGEFEARDPELIKNTAGFPGYPEGLIQSKNPYYFPYGMGNNGSDFTIGAVQLKKGMGNLFKGLIGGVVVFDRALTDEEIHTINELTEK